MEPIVGVDAAFLAFEARHTHLHVAAVVVMDPPEGKRSLFSPTSRFAQIRLMVEQRVHLVPQLRRRVVRVPLGLAHPVWADDPDFCLDDHLTRSALPAPGGLLELANLVADIVARPLDPDRPLWEITVVEGLEEGRTALVAKVHHAILDGVSGASLLATFFDLGPRPRPIRFPDSPWAPGPLPTGSALLRHAASSLAHQPELLAGTWQRGLETVLEVAEHNRQLAEAGEAPPPSPFSAPRTSLNGAVSAHRRFATTSVPLDDVHVVRRVLGGTVNDVVLTAVGGALVRLLAGRGEVPGGSLVALVPVSKRPATRVARGQGSLEGGPPALGNRISGMLVSLATDVADPVERLGEVSRATTVAKAQERLLRGSLWDDVAQVTSPALASRVARWASGLGLFDRLPPVFNVTVSSIPGPDFSLWCAGGRVVSVTPVGPVADGVGLNVTSMTYHGSLVFGLVGCRRLVPDVDALADHLRRAFAELVDAAVVARGAAG